MKSNGLVIALLVLTVLLAASVIYLRSQTIQTGYEISRLKLAERELLQQKRELTSNIRKKVRQLRKNYTLHHSKKEKKLVLPSRSHIKRIEEANP